VIPFESLDRVNRAFEPEIRRAVDGVLGSGRYVLGEQVAGFERELADSVGGGHAVGVGSGYDALTIAFRALGLTGGEVIVPATTCTATILAVLRCGLTPVLSDPHPGTLLLDPEDVIRRMSAGTVAILPVHLYGLACDMDALCAIAERHGLVLVEDCAQAQGASFRSRPVGSFGHAAAFSFYPTKNLGALGDGGAVVFRDPAAAERARILRNYGCAGRGNASEVGLNSRLDEIQAAILRAKLPHLPRACFAKNVLAGRYDLELDPVFDRPRADDRSVTARHVYPVLHPERDRLRSFLAEAGIGTEIHYPVPPWRQKALEGCAWGTYPVAERVFSRTLSLPLSVGHTDDEIRRVIRAANRFAEAERGRALPA
jgi:dTDP-4-amino-4,6-dideoxygalactose transaminase